MKAPQDADKGSLHRCSSLHGMATKHAQKSQHKLPTHALLWLNDDSVCLYADHAERWGHAAQPVQVPKAQVVLLARTHCLNMHRPNHITTGLAWI
jgi:hypothetical protein